MKTMWDRFSQTIKNYCLLCQHEISKVSKITELTFTFLYLCNPQAFRSSREDGCVNNSIHESNLHGMNE